MLLNMVIILKYFYKHFCIWLFLYVCYTITMYSVHKKIIQKMPPLLEYI